MNKVYETERLYLKVLDGSYANQVLDYVNRNKEYFKEFEPERESEFYSMAYQENLLNTDLNYINNKNMLRLWISLKEKPQKLIGQITFYNIVPFAFFACHAGYKSDKDEACKGYITEAMYKGIDIMFNEYRMHRIEAYVMPNNQASIKVLEKLGFEKEGIARKFLETNGVWEDHIHFSLINEK